MDGDFIVQRDNTVTFQGVASNSEKVKGNSTYTINANEIDSIFDRKIIISNEGLISSTGIEDFIKQAIINEFTNSTDTFLNIPYMQVTVLTHTPLNIEVTTENGIYNLMTLLGAVKELYGIYLDYEFQNDILTVSISKKESQPLKLDATISDIITYNENYKADTIAKVSVLSTNTSTVFDFFLLVDQTITTDSSDVNRAKGTIEVVTCTNDSDVLQKALDTFKNNSYQHNIVLTLIKSSKLYSQNDFIVGRPLQIKTEDNGIYNTFVSGISNKSNSKIYTVTCGNMKVTLLEKLKGVV